jgi:hypothetical protein
MVKIGGREMAVTRMLNGFSVHELRLGYRGPAWQLQLEDYRRVIIFHQGRERWLLAT